MLKFLRNLKEKHDLKTLIFYSSWSLTLTSGFSYFFGLVRDKVFAHTFGLSRTLDIYNSAFVLPDLLQSLLIGAALSAAFVPIFSQQYDKDKQLGYKYAQQVLSWGVTMLVIVGIIAVIILPYFASWIVPGFSGEELEAYLMLTRIMLLSPIIFAVSTTYGQALLSMKIFFWWGLSPVLYNIGIILGAIYLYPQWGIVGLAVGNLLGAFLHMSNRLLALRREKFEFQWRLNFELTPEMKETFALALPKFLQYGMFHFMLLNFTRITSKLAEGSITVYNYARNFQSLPVSLLGIAIALAMYPTLSHDAGKGNFKKFISDFKKNRFKCLFYTTLAAIALAAMSRIVIGLLLGGGEFDAESIDLLSKVLMIYCISIPLESMLHIYHRAFYSLKNTLIPSLMHAVTICLTILGASSLAKEIGVYAIPVSFSAGLVLHILVLSSVFPILLKKRQVNWEAIKEH